MAQDLLTISQESFEIQLYKLPTRTLVTLLKDLYHYKWEYGKYFDDQKIMDLERKETKINKELMRRGYLNPKEYKDYFKFLKDMNFKKRSF